MYLDVKKYLRARELNTPKKYALLYGFGILPVIPLGAIPVEKTVSGTLIHVTDAIEEPATKLAVTMTPSQEATPFVGETTTEPYLSKTASTTGNKRYLDKIVGGTVCWNQLVGNITQIFDNSQWSSETITNLGNNKYKITFSGTETHRCYIVTRISDTIDIITNHCYLFIPNFSITDGSFSSSSFNLKFIQTSTDIYATTIGSYMPKNTIFKSDRSGIADRFDIYNYGNSTITESTIIEFQFMLIDLTKFFSNAPAIADYVYSLEQATAGAGVQWLKDHGFIDDNYRAYNAGELISAKPTAFTVGSNTYALGGVDLRGLFKLDANNKLYCDGDIYPPSGDGERKCVFCNLDDLSWTTLYTGTNNKSLKANLPKKINGYPFYKNVMIGTPYILIGGKSGSANMSNPDSLDVGLYLYSNSGEPKTKVVYIVVPIGTSISGSIVYLTTEPTTESLTPYQNPAPIANGDTESFTDSRAVPIPCGNESHYAGEYEIEGTTGVIVYQSGINVWDEQWEVGDITESGVNVAGSNNIRSKDYIPILPNTQYYLHIGSDVNMRYYYYDENKTCINNRGGYKYADGKNTTTTSPDNAKYMRFKMFQAYGTTYNNDISINIDYTDTAYHEYVGNTYAVTFTEQGTVYGGVIDIVTGVLTITWGYIASYNGETLMGRWLSSLDEYAEGATPTTGAEVAYELATPITAQLTPQEVQMLLNENYFWAENGESMELTYIGNNRNNNGTRGAKKNRKSKQKPKKLLTF